MGDKATLGLPHFELNARVLMQYLRSPVYLLGMGVDIGGALLMIVAFAKAPVSVVQPVASAGLGALAVFSHFYLKERMSKTEWLAVAIAAMGTIGLGLTAEDQDDNTVDIRRALLTLLVCLIAVLAMAAHSLRQTRSAWGDASATAAVVGLQAGGAFGLSAACCRTGLLLGRQQMFAVPVGIGTSIGLTSTGFALQTRGFKDGNTVIVCTCAAVSAMVTGVVVGMVGLGETLPPGKEAKILQGASWLAIMAGVAMLSGAGGRRMPSQASHDPMHDTNAETSGCEDASIPVILPCGSSADDEPVNPGDVVSWVDGWAEASHRNPSLGMWPCMGVNVLMP